MPSIAILTPALTGGGAERVALNLAGGLARSGRAVRLVTLTPSATRAAEEQAAAEELHAAGVRLCRLPARRVRQAIPALIGFLRKHRPTALISHLEYLNLGAIFCRRLAGVKTRLVVVNHIQLSAEARYNAAWSVRLLPWLARLGYPLADQVVSVSAGSAADLAHMTGLPLERIKVIYNPVIGPGFRNRLACPNAHPWFVNGAVPVFVAAGRMVAQKDFGTLLAAFARVRQARRARLALFGEGPLRVALQTQTRELGIDADVQFMGYVENLPTYMQRAQAFVLSSRSEALPTVLVEALAAGCRVISTDCPSGPREILADGQFGKLVPVGNVSALAEAMLADLADQQLRAPLPVSWRPFLEAKACQEYLKLCQA